MPELQPPVGARDHVRGPAAAALTLVHYGDFECPLSRRIVGLAGELLDENAGDLRFVFRHFPLQQVHPHAFTAGQAAEAAGAQGRFWEMHDLLYRNQQALAPDDLAMYAEALGLDTARFGAELAAEVHLARVREDKRDGVQNGVRTTAHFFLEGTLYQGEDGLVQVLKRLKEHRASKKG